MRRTFQFRLYPNQAQEQTLLYWLRRCRVLYNACLEESKAAWTMQGKSLSAFDQINELPDLKRAFPAYQELPSHVLQDVIRRHSKAKQAFFRRVAQGEPARLSSLQEHHPLSPSDFPRSGRLEAGRAAPGADRARPHASHSPSSPAGQDQD